MLLYQLLLPESTFEELGNMISTSKKKKYCKAN